MLTEWRMGGIRSFLRRKRSGGCEVSDRLYGAFGAEDGWYRIVCTKETERMYGAVGENSIDFSRILYRLFPDTSIQPLGQH